jgi:hypothetical protein
VTHAFSTSTQASMRNDRLVQTGAVNPADAAYSDVCYSNGGDVILVGITSTEARYGCPRARPTWPARVPFHDWRASAVLRDATAD